MGSNLEEMRLRFGMDTASVDAATMTLLDKQKKAALEYTAFWDGALKKREAQEIATAERIKNETLAIERQKNEQSIAMARATAVEKAAANKLFFEEQAAQAAIGRGSGGGSWIDTIRGKFDPTKKELQEAEKAAAKGLKEAGKGAHGNSTAFREIFVLIREGLRGNFTRMIGSASILAGAFNALVPIVTGLVVALPLLIIDGYKFMQWRKAVAESKQSGKDVQTRSDDTAENLRAQIEALKKHGMIDTDEADVYLDRLKHPDYNTVSQVQGAVNKYLPKGGRAALMAPGFESDSDKIKKIDEIAKKEQAELDGTNKKKEDSKKLEADIAEKKEWVFKITRQIGQMEADHQQDTLSYHEALEKKVRYQLELQQDLAEQKQKQTEADKAAAEAKKVADRQLADSQRSQINAAMDEAQYASTEQLAGRGYMNYLNNLYGEHKVTYRRHGRRFTRMVRGAYDLEAGDGPYAGTAQDYELAKRQQLWDRIHGNNAQADEDRKRMISDRDYLVKSGVASPDQMLGKIEDNTAKVHTLWAGLVAAGALKVNVTGTE